MTQKKKKKNILNHPRSTINYYPPSQCLTHVINPGGLKFHGMSLCALCVCVGWGVEFGYYPMSCSGKFKFLPVILIIIICSSYIVLFLAEASSKRFTYYYPWQTCSICHLLNSSGFSNSWYQPAALCWPPYGTFRKTFIRKRQQL